MEKYTISNITLWNADQILESQDIYVEEGVIKKIAPTGTLNLSQNIKVYAFEKAVLLPAGVDAQVHLRVPGQTHKETPLTGLTAALTGGVGAVLAMPNTTPVMDCIEVCEMAKNQLESAEKQTGVKVFYTAAITKGQKGEEITDFKALLNWGVKAFTDDGRGVDSDEVMEKAFKKADECGAALLQHAEFSGHKGVLAPGPVQKKLNIPPYFPDPEFKMVHRDIALLEKYPNARYHVLHISSAKTVQALTEAKNKGLNISGEVTPHHLLFTSEDIHEKDTSYKMNPPLRNKDDREALIEALADGRLSFIATDHAPHDPGSKGEDFCCSAFGTTALEVSLRVLLKLYLEKRITAQRLVEVFSFAPALFLGIENEYGKIKEGRKIQAIVLDAHCAESPVTKEELKSLSQNSCFLGYPLPGKIKAFFQPEKVHLF